MTAQPLTPLRVQSSATADGNGRHTEDRVALALEEYGASLESPQPMSREALLAKYSDIADELIGCLDSLDFIRQVAPQLSDVAAASVNADATNGLPSSVQADGSTVGVLSDFRIMREIGRGGMGVVYEAEQLSIGRRVALKVLPFAAMLDKQQLNRFKNEARAAGTLDHPNIVAIHSVGVERGVHYYAMQLIEGQNLAQVVAAGDCPDFAKSAEQNGTVPLFQAADTAPVAALSTLRTTQPRDYFRTIAQLGIQAAEALDHAHQNGILHRDIKPANLLLDDTGKLWITDFGLARLEADAGMTMTGDVLGTLRYMSPEQAAGKRVVVDHRSDIYSLGATLYELLTLQPAYSGDDRQELLRQIAFEEPITPRQINGRIPQDLETIILKSIEKNPADRYATAQEFADDVRRFVEDHTIRARPPSLVAIARKWVRRHRPLVVSVALSTVVLLVMSLAIFANSNARIRREAEATAAALADKTKAEANAREAVKSSNENFSRLLMLIGSLFEHVGPEQLRSRPEMKVLRDEIEKQLTERTTTRPNDATAWYSRGATYFQLREYEQAVSDLTQAITLNPRLVLAWQVRGNAYNELGQHVNAIHDLTEALRLEPHVDAFFVYNERAASYCELNRFSDAVLDCDRALAIRPNDWHPWATRGKASYFENQFAAAIDNFSNAIEFAGDEPVIWYYFGARAVCYEKMGRYEEACKDYAQAVDLHPGGSQQVFEPLFPMFLNNYAIPGGAGFARRPAGQAVDRL